MTHFLVHGALALHALAGLHAGGQRLGAAGAAPWPSQVPTLNFQLPGVFPSPGGHGAAPGVPDPAPAPVPGLSGSVNTILAWVKWGALIAGVLGLSLCAFKMMVGHRNRSTFAADGAAGIPWVLAGLSLVATGAGIVGVFL